MFYFFDQSHRVRVLEAQVQAITITASIKGSIMTSRTIDAVREGALKEVTSSSSAGSAIDLTSGEKSIIINVNPIVQACADMAMRLAKVPMVTYNEPIVAAMSAIGCKSVMSQNSK